MAAMVRVPAAEAALALGVAVVQPVMAAAEAVQEDMEEKVEMEVETIPPIEITL